MSILCDLKNNHSRIFDGFVYSLLPTAYSLLIYGHGLDRHGIHYTKPRPKALA